MKKAAAVLVAAASIASAETAIYDRWDSGEAALAGEAGQGFFEALNIEAQLLPGGFYQPSLVKQGQLGPLRVVCDTYPKTACILSWKADSALKSVAATARELGRSPCLKAVSAREGRLSVSCGPNGLALARADEPGASKAFAVAMDSLKAFGR
ncbi:MAG: hypothetical protein HY077_05325 [Elusimicrobia bacterium]|nr:hypothetical protein [Elusimicrobiota bacterium]